MGVAVWDSVDCAETKVIKQAEKTNATQRIFFFMTLVFAGRSGGVDANVSLWNEILSPNVYYISKKAT